MRSLLVLVIKKLIKIPTLQRVVDFCWVGSWVALFLKVNTNQVMQSGHGKTLAPTTALLLQTKVEGKRKMCVNVGRILK